MRDRQSLLLTPDQGRFATKSYQNTATSLFRRRIGGRGHLDIADDFRVPRQQSKLSRSVSHHKYHSMVMNGAKVIQ